MSHENIGIQHRNSSNLQVICFIIPPIVYPVITIYRPNCFITDVLILAIVKATAMAVVAAVIPPAMTIWYIRMFASSLCTW